MMVKAIMIDPVARKVSGIEVSLTLLDDEPEAGPQVNFKDLSPCSPVKASRRGS
jgi:hypothetical protein